MDIDIDIDEDLEEELVEEERTEILHVGALDLQLPPEADMPIIVDDADDDDDMTLGSPSTDDISPEVESNDVFGDYALLGQVGGNDEVEVWVAGDQNHGTTCVLKRVPRPSESRTEVANISEEIRVTEHLSHPNLVETLAGGIIDGIPFITMELVDGMSLTELHGVMGQSQRPLGAVLDLGIQIAEALAYVHQALDNAGTALNLIHGNLRPQNVFVTREGHAKLGEVAIAFPVASAELEKRVCLPYLAPEQFGRHPVSHQADIYTLGLILIELISGKSAAPFGSVALQNPRSWIQGLDIEISADVLDFLCAMTKKAAGERPADALQVARTLRLLFQRHGGGVSLSDYLRERVFTHVPTIDSVAEEELSALSRQDTPTTEQASPIELPLDALEEISYPSTVSLIIEEIDWDAPDDTGQGSIKVLNPGVEDAREIDPVPPLDNPELIIHDPGPPRTMRLGTLGRETLAADPAFRHAVGLKTAKLVNDYKEWDYYLLAGDELGPRIIQKSLTSARPYQDQKVIFLRESELISAFNLEEDAHLLEHGSVWAGDESGYGETRLPSQDPAYLRYHERMLVRSAPRRSTSVRGKVLRFLGK